MTTRTKKKSKRYDGATLSRQCAGISIQTDSGDAVAILEERTMTTTIHEKAGTEMFSSVSTAALPTGLQPSVIDAQVEKFHTNGRLYYLATAVVTMLSVLVLFGMHYADDLDIEDWAESGTTTLMAYGGLVAAFFLWRRAEDSMDKLKTLAGMLRNYYANSEKK